MLVPSQRSHLVEEALGHHLAPCRHVCPTHRVVVVADVEGVVAGPDAIRPELIVLCLGERGGRAEAPEDGAPDPRGDAPHGRHDHLAAGLEALHLLLEASREGAVVDLGAGPAEDDVLEEVAVFGAPLESVEMLADLRSGVVHHKGHTVRELRGGREHVSGGGEGDRGGDSGGRQ
jgi:hypothetical protein